MANGPGLRHQHRRPPSRLAARRLLRAVEQSHAQGQAQRRVSHRTPHRGVCQIPGRARPSQAVPAIPLLLQHPHSDSGVQETHRPLSVQGGQGVRGQNTDRAGARWHQPPATGQPGPGHDGGRRGRQRRRTLGQADRTQARRKHGRHIFQRQRRSQHPTARTLRPRLQPAAPRRQRLAVRGRRARADDHPRPRRHPARQRVTQADGEHGFLPDHARSGRPTASAQAAHRRPKPHAPAQRQ